MEKTFDFEGRTYKIINEGSGEADLCKWENKFSDCVRTREIFAFHPWWIGKKFRWLKKIQIKQRLVFVRYSDFDDGWNYQEYWKPWESRWETEEILN